VLSFSSGVVDSCVFWLKCSKSGDKLRGQQIGWSLDAQLYCVVCVSWLYGARSYSVDLPVEDIGWSVYWLCFTLPLSYRTCIKWLILCGILTILRVRWSSCCVVCWLMALAGLSPWITESWVCRCRCRWDYCGSFRAPSCLMLSHIHFIRAHLYHWIESRCVWVCDSELVLSVLKLRVRCSKPVAVRVEVCCYVSCKYNNKVIKSMIHYNYKNHICV